MPEGGNASSPKFDASPKLVKDVSAKRSAVSVNLRSPTLRQLLPKNMASTSSAQDATAASAYASKLEEEFGKLSLEKVQQLIQNYSNVKEDSQASAVSFYLSTSSQFIFPFELFLFIN